MNAIKTVYGYVCKLEELLVQVILFLLMVVIFGNAVLRTFGYPLNWAMDFSLLLFAWLIFLGADVTIRNTNLVRIDLLYNKFPASVRLGLFLIFNAMAIAFLGILVFQGFDLAFANLYRIFHSLGLSFAWATISVPIGSALMIISITIKSVKQVKEYRDTVSS